MQNWSLVAGAYEHPQLQLTITCPCDLHIQLPSISLGADAPVPLQDKGRDRQTDRQAERTNRYSALAVSPRLSLTLKTEVCIAFQS